MRSTPIIASVLGAVFMSTGSGAPLDDACALLTQAQVNAALGVSTGSPQQPVRRSCIWSGPTEDRGTRKVLVTLIQMPAFNIGKTAVPGVTTTAVSGLGDEAYYASSARTRITTLRVKKGNTPFAIEVRNYSFSDDQIRTAERALAQEVLAKL